MNVKNSDLIDSFDSIKKELFVPDSEKDIVYSDADIKIADDRYLVRSFVLAKMFEYCNFSKDDSKIGFVEVENNHFVEAEVV